MSKKKSEDKSTGSNSYRTSQLALSIQALSYRELMSMASCLADQLGEYDIEVNEETISAVLDQWSWDITGGAE